MPQHRARNAQARNAQDEEATLSFLRDLGERHASQAAPQPTRPRGRRTNFFTGAWGSGGFDGAKRDRLSEEWSPGTIGPNRLHQMDARTLRERARDLVLNNPLALSGVEAYVTNVIECGITPNPKFKDADRRNAWTNAWRIWGGMTPVSESESDITGHDTIYGLQALFLMEVIIAGGCLIHYTELPKSRERRIPLTMELLPEERFATDRDTYSGLSRNPKTRNRVIRGVEINAHGHPVAYHITPELENDVGSNDGSTIRLKAENCSYGFFRRRAGQYRGHSLLHAVVVWLWRLGYYVDAELVASQQKSNWSYMVNTKDAEEGIEFTGLSDNEPEDGLTDFYGNRIDKTEMGMIWRGRPGDQITAIGPNVPQSESLPWIDLIKDSIAIGLGLSPFELTRDGSKMNFSSIRAVANGDQKRYRRMQQFAISHFGNPTWRRFATVAARIGIEGFPRPSQFLSQIDEWLDVKWRPPGWRSVNPLDDARAEDIKINDTHTLTREEVIASEGGRDDWEETFSQLDREYDRLEEYELATRETAASVDPGAGAGAVSNEQERGSQRTSQAGRTMPRRRRAHFNAPPSIQTLHDSQRDHTGGSP